MTTMAHLSTPQPWTGDNGKLWAVVGGSDIRATFRDRTQAETYAAHENDASRTFGSRDREPYRVVEVPAPSKLTIAIEPDVEDPGGAE